MKSRKWKRGADGVWFVERTRTYGIVVDGVGTGTVGVVGLTVGVPSVVGNIVGTIVGGDLHGEREMKIVSEWPGEGRKHRLRK
jgi:hypothetical protein